MCLAAIAINQHPKYKLVCIANRDEFHNRPAAPMQWWEDQNTLAGVDLQAKGTWMGINKQGRFALITNVRNPGLNAASDAPSRGQLVIDYLRDQRLPSTEDKKNMAAYNLITADLQANSWAFETNQFEKESGQPAERQILENGIYGLSNATLNTPWPKTVALTMKLQTELMENENLNQDWLFNVLSDESQAEDQDLPSTGVPYNWEKMLSSIKIVSPVYGTRCTTVLTVDHQNHVNVEERSFNPEGEVTDTRVFEFSLVR